MAGNSEYDTPTKQSKRTESFGSNLKVPNITLTERIGRGGFGDVYIGEHHILKTKVAVKIVAANQSDPTWSARFQREAQSLSRLVHPGIVKVFSFSFLENGQAAMVMEYVEGRSLHEVVQDMGPLSAKRSVHICKQLCDALSYAHDLGVVHRDVKPSNIIVGDHDQVKLLDFGIAKLLDDSSDDDLKSSKKVSQKLTATGQFMGTPAFMSPEQCEGKAAKPASDIYSLACVLYFMLLGRNVFSGNSDAEVMLKHCKTTPKLKKLSLPDDLMEVLVKALRKDPKDRYSSCSSMLSDLSSADLGTVRKKDKKFSAKSLAVILVGALPLLLLGKLCMNRLEADKENASAKQQVEKFKSLYAAGQREFNEKNYKSAVSFLKEAVAKDLPQSERYRRLGAYDLLLAFQKGEHDSFARVAKEMYDITEHKEFKYAPLNAEEKLRLRARIYLANAKAHRTDLPAFERFIDQASKILNAKSAIVYKSLIPEQLESLSLKADYKRSQGRFEDAYELDKIAYRSIVYHGLGRDQMLEYASDGLQSCVESRTPSKFREIHRKVMIEMIPLLDNTTYMQLPVFAGLIGASYNEDEGSELASFARKLRAASAFKNHQDDYIVSYSVLNTFQHAVAVSKGDLSSFTPNEIAYFEKEVRRLLAKCSDPKEFNSLIDLSASLVRAKLFSAGEQEALRERDSLVAAVPASLWKLKLFASANDAIVRTRKSISEPIVEKMNLRFLEMLNTVANDTKTTSEQQQQLTADVVNAGLDNMQNMVLESRLNPAKKLNAFLQWNQVLRGHPAIDSIVKFQTVEYAGGVISNASLKSEKYEQVLEQLADQYLSLLDPYNSCKSDRDASILIRGFIAIAEAFTAQSRDDKRWLFTSKYSEIFNRKNYFGSASIRKFCVVYWLYAASVAKAEGVNPTLFQEYRANLENMTEESLSGNFQGAHVFAAAAVAKIYCAKGDKSEALAFLARQIKAAESKKVSPQLMSVLKNEFGKIAKP